MSALSPRLAEARLQHQYPHLNLRWSLADMDRLQALAAARKTVSQIAFEMDTTEVEVRRLCERNGIWVRP